MEREREMRERERERGERGRVRRARETVGCRLHGEDGFRDCPGADLGQWK